MVGGEDTFLTYIYMQTTWTLVDMVLVIEVDTILGGINEHSVA